MEIWYSVLGDLAQAGAVSEIQLVRQVDTVTASPETANRYLIGTDFVHRYRACTAEVDRLYTVS